MTDYAKYHESEEYIHVWFYNENDKPFRIGEKMNELNDEAYMNGYNWDAVLNYYLTKNAPDVMESMDADPEAGSYVAIYPNTPENLLRAQKFVEIIQHLIENETLLYKMVVEASDEIEWD